MLYCEHLHNFVDSSLNVQCFFILVGFKHNMKITFEVETSTFCWTVYFREYSWIDILKYVFVMRQVISQFNVIVFPFIWKFSYNFQYFLLKNIFPVEVEEIFVLANVLVKLLRRTFFPKHINHLMFVFINLTFNLTKMDLSFW